MRLMGLVLILTIACLGCKPPEGKTTPGTTGSNETAAPEVSNETMPPPAEDVKPAEEAPKEEMTKPAEKVAPMEPPKEEPKAEPAPPAETPKEEAKPEEVDPAAAAQPTPADSVEGLLDEKPAPEAGAEMKKAEPTETVSTEATGPVETALTPDNTLVQFVGTHVGDKPDPRTGKFGKLTGTAKAADGKLSEVSVTIETASIETEFEKLTNHLKSPDFFDVRQHPEAKFVSKKIEAGDDGKFNITGDLTLLGETKSITFPAVVTIGKEVNLTAEFVIDRTEFGMTYSPDKVHKDVTMTIKVGK
ncbi:YceI family protein [Bremerella cremea]|uniref:YceI family protein n=1 Tax=Bremerella cremea TaxID=1031537 RepID=UPI0031EDB094